MSMQKIKVCHQRSGSKQPLHKQNIHRWLQNDAQSLKRCPIVLQGHLPNFNVTWKKSMSFTWIEHIRTVAPVLIHKWLRINVINIMGFFYFGSLLSKEMPCNTLIWPLCNQTKYPFPVEVLKLFPNFKCWDFPNRKKWGFFIRGSKNTWA